jgi:hypothetical protein
MIEVSKKHEKYEFHAYIVWNNRKKKGLLQSLPVAKIECYDSVAKPLCSGIDINPHIIMNMFLAR